MVSCRKLCLHPTRFWITGTMEGIDIEKDVWRAAHLIYLPDHDIPGPGQIWELLLSLFERQPPRDIPAGSSTGCSTAVARSWNCGSQLAEDHSCRQAWWATLFIYLPEYDIPGPGQIWELFSRCLNGSFLEISLLAALQACSTAVARSWNCGSQLAEDHSCRQARRAALLVYLPGPG